MTTIHTLPEYVVSKIAAGEVIERPAYAVKELIDNAIDARATEIYIDIVNSGLQKIQVTDDGIGMDQNDLMLSIQPHTTSKLIHEDDLLSIRSMGFRGEALASIAAVGTLNIQSRMKNNAAGTRIQSTNGTVTISPVGMPYGTQVTIEGLFRSTPARKKFLKSDRTEFRHIVDIVTAFAIAFPDISWKLSHNGNVLFDLPKTETIHERIGILFGQTLITYGIPIQYEEHGIEIRGIITKPQLTHHTTSKIHTFVNRRHISDLLVTRAIRDAYGTLIDPHAYPHAILFFTIPFELVDVNVHPRKEHVHFYDTSRVYDTIVKGIQETLLAHDLAPQLLINGKTRSRADELTATIAASVLKDTVLPKNQYLSMTDTFMQIDNLYIVAKTDQGLLIVDQHAAHERVLFEQFHDAFLREQNKQQIIKLDTPIPLDLSLREQKILEEHKDTFTKLGFIIQEIPRHCEESSTKQSLSIKSNYYELIAVPKFFQDRDCVVIIQELLDNWADAPTQQTIDQTSHAMLAYLACKSAIKSGDPLTTEQCKKLLEELSITNNRETCPHGRPTVIEISIAALNKSFKRR